MNRWVTLILALILFESSLSFGAFHPDKDCPTDFLGRENLEKLIRDKGIKSVSEILKLMPACYKNNHVKVFNSSSLQCATPKAPRIIIYLPEPHTNTTCSFNSGNREDYKEFYEKDPNIDCHENTLECIHHTEDSRYEFYEVVVPQDDQGKPFSRSQDLRSHKKLGQTYLSDVNPPTCMTSCHRGTSIPGQRPEPRPTIENYPLWAGFYGSYHDELYRGNKSLMSPKEIENFTHAYYPYKKENARYSELQELVDENLVPIKTAVSYRSKPAIDLQNAYESQNFKRIAKKFTDEPTLSRIWPFRYALVAALACNDDVDRYSTSQSTMERHYKVPGGSVGIYKTNGGIQKTFYDEKGEVNYHPTSDMLNAKVPEGLSFPIDSFVPLEVKALLPISYQSVVSEALKDHLDNLKHQMDLQKTFGSTIPDEVTEQYSRDFKNDPAAPESTYKVYYADSLSYPARLGTLARNLGISTEDWSLTFRKTLDFSAGSHNPGQILPFLAEKLLAGEPELADVINKTRYGMDVDFCQSLRQKSLTTLSEAFKKGEIKIAPITSSTTSGLNPKSGTQKDCNSLPVPPPELNSCIQCHVFGTETKIPFNNPKELSARLKLPVSSDEPEILFKKIHVLVQSGNMPYSIKTSAEQKAALIKYFESLNQLQCDDENKNHSNEAGSPSH